MSPALIAAGILVLAGLIAVLALKVIKKVLKIVLSIILAIILLAICIGSFRPVYAADDKNAAYVAEKYLEYDNYSHGTKLEDYNVQNAEFVEDSIHMNFDVLPANTKSRNEWSAGSGEENDSGWINNKLFFVKYAKIGNMYVFFNAGF